MTEVARLSAVNSRLVLYRTGIVNPFRIPIVSKPLNYQI